jgi:charged multivesicular body protein 3
MFSFSKKPDPKEQARAWISSLKKDMRAIDRDVREVEREQAKIKADIKRQAKKGDRKALVILAKSLARSEKTVANLIGTRAQLNSATMQIQEQIGTLKVVGAMGQSAQLMATMNRLVSIPQVAQTTKALAREMERAGIISEIVAEAHEDLDPEEIAEMADEEVDRVIAEVTNGEFKSIAEMTKKNAKSHAEVEEDQDDEIKNSEAELIR